ncbi:hypothetical protein HIM_02663 [Hirsutella minnesotensis 3608]|nr:hypothetical protein HIM_02663 [Hirsutella minnesotensis 3608]
MPGITHWSSPGFMAFFACTSSYPAAIADMWSAAFNGAHFNWICSPAVTELEAVVMDWLAPAGASGSASEAIVTVMVAARDRYLAAHLPSSSSPDALDDDDTWRLRSRLVALGSSSTHSSTKKAAQILGVRFVEVPVGPDSDFAIDGPALSRVLADLDARGLEPFFLTATLGTTDTCAVDAFADIAAVLAPRAGTPRDVWVHVDAAYAGSALVLDDHKHLAAPFARFHSFNFNPHKWLLTTFDCSALWVRDRAYLVRSSLSIKPPYLRNQLSDSGLVTDYRDWQIPLGRRFRSLSIFTPARFALVTLRVVGPDPAAVNARTEALYNRINASGKFFLTSTVIGGNFAIRVSTSVASVRDEHVEQLFDLLVEGAQELVTGAEPQSNGKTV